MGLLALNLRADDTGGLTGVTTLRPGTVASRRATADECGASFDKLGTVLLCPAGRAELPRVPGSAKHARHAGAGEHSQSAIASGRRRVGTDRPAVDALGQLLLLHCRRAAASCRPSPSRPCARFQPRPPCMLIVLSLGYRLPATLAEWRLFILFAGFNTRAALRSHRVGPGARHRRHGRHPECHRRRCSASSWPIC